MDFASSEWRNVTMVGTGGGYNGWVLRGNYTNPTAVNCAGFGANQGFATSVGNNNASDGVTPTSASLPYKTYSAQFVSTTGDFKVKAGADLINAGVRDQANTNDLDIKGRARSITTPTIGCYEYAAAASTVPTLSLAEMTSITQTGGIPRVYATAP
jgi:hypothetical protein